MKLERVISDLKSHVNEIPEIRESLVSAVDLLIELKKWRKNPFKMVKDECLKYPDRIADEDTDGDSVCKGCLFYDSCYLYLDEIPQYWEWETRSWDEIFQEKDDDNEE